MEGSSIHPERYDVEKLSLILWRERELLDLLAFKLELEQLVLASGRTRWLTHCTNDVESVLGELRETEVLRSIASDEAAGDLGLLPGASLGQLADAAPEPWGAILSDHRSALVEITGQIKEISEENRGLLTTGYRSARETLLSIGVAADGYAPDGTVVLGGPRRRLVDRSL
jgi:hypothetical protein